MDPVILLGAGGESLTLSEYLNIIYFHSDITNLTTDRKQNNKPLFFIKHTLFVCSVSGPNVPQYAHSIWMFSLCSKCSSIRTLYLDVQSVVQMFLNTHSLFGCSVCGPNVPQYAHPIWIFSLWSKCSSIRTLYLDAQSVVQMS